MCPCSCLSSCMQTSIFGNPPPCCLASKKICGETAQLLVAAGARHELADRLFGALVVVQDGVHLFRDGHLYAVACGQTERGGGTANAFCNLAVEAGDDLGKLAAASQFDAHGAIARERASARKHQVADAGEPGEGLAAASGGDGKAGHLCDAACN